MFGLFKRSSGGGGKPSLDAVHFDTTGYAAQGEPQPGKVRVWHTPEGDGLGVYLFPVRPDLPANASSLDELAAFYARLLGDSGANWLKCEWWSQANARPSAPFSRCRNSRQAARTSGRSQCRSGISASSSSASAGNAGRPA